MLVMSSADGQLARQPLLIPWLWECEHYFSSFFLFCLFCFCFGDFFISFPCFALLVAFCLRLIACLIGVLLVLPFLRVSAELETSLWNEWKVNYIEGLLVCLLFFWIDFRSRDLDKLWFRLCFPPPSLAPSSTSFRALQLEVESIMGEVEFPVFPLVLRMLSIRFRVKCGSLSSIHEPLSLLAFLSFTHIFCVRKWALQEL